MTGDLLVGLGLAGPRGFGGVTPKVVLGQPKCASPKILLGLRFGREELGRLPLVSLIVWYLHLDSIPKFNCNSTSTRYISHPCLRYHNGMGTIAIVNLRMFAILLIFAAAGMHDRRTTTRSMRAT